MDLLDAPGTPPHGLARGVQVLGDFLDAEGAALVSIEVQLVDAPNGGGFGLVNR
mgnify:CR=1 FL=1